MSAADREKWNRIYAKQKDSEPGHPAAVLTDNAGLLPDTGRALDVACGSGANSLFLAQRGLAVEAWDISDVATSQLAEHAEGLALTPRAIDITPAVFTGEQFDVIVNCQYLDRSIVAPMIAALTPGGLIFFQTFLAERKLEAGPSNPDFLLGEGELQSMMQDLEVLAERDGAAVEAPSDPIAGRAYIVARKRP